MALLEVGLGGRFDAVNVVDSDVAILTTVGLDHTDWLGDTEEAIGFEKAGIFRTGRPAVCSTRTPPQSVRRYAAENGVPLFVNGEDFSVTADEKAMTWRFREEEPMQLALPGLPGTHQIDNAAGVLTALHLSPLDVSAGNLSRGLSNARLQGRLQPISDSPEVLLDVAHNPQAAAALAEVLLERGRPTSVVLGMYADKDIAGFVTALDDVVEAWFIGGLSGPRGASMDDLKETLGSLETRGSISYHESIDTAYNAAIEEVAEGAQVVVTGSFETVAAVSRMVTRTHSS